MKSRQLLREMGFAGTFYVTSAAVLRKSISEMLNSANVFEGPNDGLAYVSPHAGHKYSGKIAAATYKSISLNKHAEKGTTFVIIGPNHTGLGSAVSVSMANWRTPFGDITNDIELSEEICRYRGIEPDEIAHVDEHSIEVQLPFLKYIAPDSKACFICMMDQDIETCKLLERAISESAKKLDRKTIIIASSDMDHYEPEKVAMRKDFEVFRYLTKMEPEEFNLSVEKAQDSICGYGPITTAMMFSKRNGGKKGEIICYGNSGAETGDHKSVVSYASIVFH